MSYCKMTYTELVKIVANEFESTCNEEGFSTFAEMTRCYQMDSADIKGEVVSVVRETKGAYMDEDSGEITLDDGSDEPYKYKPFIAAVKKELRSRGY